MKLSEEKIIGCTEFEDHLSDYLEKTLPSHKHKAVAAHALKCPLCHSLLNEVKDAVAVCHQLNEPKKTLTSLEARILNATVPETSMSCNDFEEYLTDYLDGFLAAKTFHRWERHAVLCEDCTDLPGEVVRSIAACYTYKLEELPLPEGLNAKILENTIGTSEAKAVKASWGSQVREWMRGLSVPISVPQLAPVAMMLLMAIMFFSQITGNSFGGAYQKSFELAGQTYQQGADIMLGGKNTPSNQPANNQKPTEGTFIKKDK
jgi:predicted anti-sigma-YlaC factor YlaD